jgi:chromosome segregation ATPase
MESVELNLILLQMEVETKKYELKSMQSAMEKKETNMKKMEEHMTNLQAKLNQKESLNDGLMSTIHEISVQKTEMIKESIKCKSAVNIIREELKQH